MKIWRVIPLIISNFSLIFGISPNSLLSVNESSRSPGLFNYSLTFKYSIKFFNDDHLAKLAKDLKLVWTTQFNSKNFSLEYNFGKFSTVADIKKFQILKLGYSNRTKVMVIFKINEILKRKFECELFGENYFFNVYLLNYFSKEKYHSISLPRNITALITFSKNNSSLNITNDFNEFNKNCQDVHQRKLIFTISTVSGVGIILFIMLYLCDLKDRRNIVSPEN